MRDRREHCCDGQMLKLFDAFVAHRPIDGRLKVFLPKGYKETMGSQECPEKVGQSYTPLSAISDRPSQLRSGMSFATVSQEGDNFLVSCHWPEICDLGRHRCHL